MAGEEIRISGIMLHKSLIDDAALLTDEEFGRLVRYGLHLLKGDADPSALTGEERLFRPLIERYVTEDNERYSKVVEKRAEAARKRWESKNKDMQMHANASTCIKCNANDANTNTNTNTNTNISTYVDINNITLAQNFARFWEAYPKKKGKADAEKAFKKVKVPVEDLLQALEKQKKTSDWIRESGRFIPYPATWLNGKRWEDDTDPGRLSGRAYVDISDPHAYDGEEDKSEELNSWI